MSRRANTSLIGVFVLGGAALLLSFVVLFGNLTLFQDAVPFELYFDTSVSGLNEGAPVLFRGVKVGRVTDIRLEANPQSKDVKIPVTIEIDPRRIEQIGSSSSPGELFTSLIENGLRAKLGIQSYITGQCLIELDFEPDTPINLVQDEATPVEIPTTRSGFQELSATVERLPINDLMNKLISALEGIEKTVNSPKLHNSISSLNQTMKTVQETALALKSRIPSLMDGAENALSSFERAARTAENSTRNIESDARAALDRASSAISSTESGLDQAVRDVAQAAGEARAAFVQLRKTFSLEHGTAAELAQGMSATLNQVQEAMTQASTTLESLAGMGGSDSPIGYELTKTLREVSSAARSLKTLADTLERNPEAIFRGKSR